MQITDESPGKESPEGVETGPGRPTTDAGRADKHHPPRRGYCQRCQQDVAVATKWRFAGVRNGGMESQPVCVSCGRVLQIS
jgi:hypothetical protein